MRGSFCKNIEDWFGYGKFNVSLSCKRLMFNF